MKTALYRQYDKDGKLLYVGISLNYARRLKEHYKGSAWFLDVEKITLEWFDTRDDALKAERDAIKSESPECNIHLQRDDEDVFDKCSDVRDFQGMSALLMRYIEQKNKIFLTKGDVANCIGVPTNALNAWLKTHKLKPMKPFAPDRIQEVYYIDDVIDAIHKTVWEGRNASS